MIKNLVTLAVAAGLSFSALAATTETLDVHYMYGTTDGAHSVEFTGESGQVEVGSWFHGDVAADGSITLDLSTFTNCEDYTAKVLNSDGYMMTFEGTMDACPEFETYYMPALQQLAINATDENVVENSAYVQLSFIRNTGTTYKIAEFHYDSVLGFTSANNTTIPAGFNTSLEMGTINVNVYDYAGTVTHTYSFEGREALQAMGSTEVITIVPIQRTNGVPEFYEYDIAVLEVLLNDIGVDIDSLNNTSIKLFDQFGTEIFFSEYEGAIITPWVLFAGFPVMQKADVLLRVAYAEVSGIQFNILPALAGLTLEEFCQKPLTSDTGVCN